MPHFNLLGNVRESHTYILYAGAIARSFAYYGRGTGPIILDNVQCLGTETRLIDCPANALTIHNCVHSEDAGVQCQFGKVYKYMQYQLIDIALCTSPSELLSSNISL